MSIRRALLVRFAGLILLTFSIFSVGLYVFVRAPAARQIAESEMQRAQKEIEASWTALVSQIERVVLTARQWGVEGDLDLHEYRNFNRRFIPVLEHRPQISSVIFADDTGRETFLVRMPDGQWHTRITDPGKWGKSQRWLRWTAGGELAGEAWRESDYNPLQRPWHIGAMGLQKDAAVFWTEPYIFFTTKDPGITAANRWRDPTTGKSRIIAFDVKLTDLSRVTVADIFGALTATDRPYKKGKLLSEAVKIMSFMRKDQHIDPDLFDLFLTSGVYREYAERYLETKFIDDVDIGAYVGGGGRRQPVPVTAEPAHA